MNGLVVSMWPKICRENEGAKTVHLDAEEYGTTKTIQCIVCLLAP
jgi:hypothetical protein